MNFIHYTLTTTHDTRTVLCFGSVPYWSNLSHWYWGNRTTAQCLEGTLNIIGIYMQILYKRNLISTLTTHPRPNTPHKKKNKKSVNIISYNHPKMYAIPFPQDSVWA